MSILIIWKKRVIRIPIYSYNNPTFGYLFTPPSQTYICDIFNKLTFKNNN